MEPGKPKGPPLWWLVRRMGLRPDELLRHYGLLKAPVNVFELARRMGIEIRTQSGSSYSGVVRSGPDGAVITLRSEDPPARKRFTVAHEIGHLMLHNIGVAYRDESYTGTPQEVEANQFAAELLMPDELFDSVLMRHGTDPKTLAKIFGVSDLSARVRLMKWTQL